MIQLQSILNPNLKRDPTNERMKVFISMYQYTEQTKAKPLAVGSLRGQSGWSPVIQWAFRKSTLTSAISQL